jgi:hypothetical protein
VAIEAEGTRAQAAVETAIGRLQGTATRATELRVHYAALAARHQAALEGLRAATGGVLAVVEGALQGGAWGQGAGVVRAIEGVQEQAACLPDDKARVAANPNPNPNPNWTTRPGWQHPNPNPNWMTRPGWRHPNPNPNPNWMTRPGWRSRGPVARPSP